jgi:hypothetical protein
MFMSVSISPVRVGNAQQIVWFERDFDERQHDEHRFMCISAESVRTHAVVVLAPALGDDLGLLDYRENLAVHCRCCDD